MNEKNKTTILGTDNKPINKAFMGFECQICKKFFSEIPQFEEDECPEYLQHYLRPVYKSLELKIPMWVLVELVDEKTNWKKDAESRDEAIPDFETWIIDNLSIPARMCKDVLEQEESP